MYVKVETFGIGITSYYTLLSVWEKKSQPKVKQILGDLSTQNTDLSTQKAGTTEVGVSLEFQKYKVPKYAKHIIVQILSISQCQKYPKV